MSQRTIAIGLIVIALGVAIFAFTQQQQSAKNEATAVANANTAATAQAEAAAAQQTAVEQMNMQATGQAQAEAARAAAETSAQQAAATAAAALAEATDQADNAAQAQAGATQQAASAATAQAQAKQYAASATSVQNEALQQASTAAALQAELTAEANQQATQQSDAASTAAALQTELTAQANRQATQQSRAASTAAALQAELTAEANQQATQQSLSTSNAATAAAQATQNALTLNTEQTNRATSEAALAATLQNAQNQVANLAATSTAAYDSMQATLSGMSAQLIPSASPEETIRFLVDQGIIPANTGELTSRLGKTTIDLTGRTNVNKWIYLPGRFSDFVISTDVTWGSGAESDHCDIVFRHMDDKNHYIIGINRLGNAFFSAYVSGAWEQGDTTAAPSSIQTEPDGVNHIVVVGVGNNFTLYVNGHLVATYHHSGFPEGQLAVEAGTDQGMTGSGCTFENSWAWDLLPQSLLPTVSPPAIVSSGDVFPVPDLTEKYTTKSGALTFYYPSVWRLTESGDNTVTLYTKGYTLGDFSSLQSGRMAIFLSVVSGANTLDTTLTLKYLTDSLSKGLGDQGNPVVFGEPQPLSLTGHDAFKSIGVSPSLGIEIIMYPEDGQFVTVLIFCVPDEIQSWEPTLIAFTETIKQTQLGLR